MCGIAGSRRERRRGPRPARRARAGARDDRRASLTAGPDASGVHRSGPPALGHTRLSIIDLSTDANQPMLSADGQVVLVFNGEIYNFRDLAAELRDAGVRAADAFGHRGAAASCTACTGRRSSARCAACSRSRSGTRAGGGCCWRAIGWARSRSSSTSASAGCRSRRSCRRCSPTATSSAAPTRSAMHAYLALGYVPSDFAAIAGVRKLAPGSIAVFEDGKLAEERYWKLRFAPRQRSAEDFVEELRHHLFEAVKMRLVSDVPLGAFLSGGIDSSAVVAIMSKVGAKPVKTFSIGFDEKDFSEVDLRAPGGAPLRDRPPRGGAAPARRRAAAQAGARLRRAVRRSVGAADVPAVAR